MNTAPRLLAIDVGNTQTVIGLFEGKELNVSWRLGSVARRASSNSPNTSAVSTAPTWTGKKRAFNAR